MYNVYAWLTNFNFRQCFLFILYKYGKMFITHYYTLHFASVWLNCSFSHLFRTSSSWYSFWILLFFIHILNSHPAMKRSPIYLKRFHSRTAHQCHTWLVCILLKRIGDVLYSHYRLPTRQPLPMHIIQYNVCSFLLSEIEARIQFSSLSMYNMLHLLF